MTGELPPRLPSLPLGDDPIPQLDRLGSSELEDRLEDPQPEPLGADEGATLDHADLGLLAARGGEEAQGWSGDAVGVAGPAGLRRALHQVALPVQLLVPLETLERLEHAQVGRGDHGAPSLAR